MLRKERSAFVSLRNQLATLLLRELKEIRRTARFLFRGHPEIVEEFTSTYQRERCRAYRKRTASTAPRETV